MSMDNSGELSALGPVTGQTTSFKDLGIDGDEGSLGAVVDLSWGSPHLSVSTQSASYEGSGTVKSNITLDGHTFVANTDVDSRMDVGLHSMLLTFDLVPGDNAEFGFGIGVTAIDFLLALEDTATKQELVGESLLPIPVVGVRGSMDAGPITLNGVLSGMTVSVDEGEVDMRDYDLFGRWKFAGGEEHLIGSVTFGWRRTKVDLEFEDAGDSIALDFTSGGPYVGLSLHF